MCDGALLCWGWLNTCLPMGSECIPCFTLLLIVVFALPFQLSLYQPMSFLTFTLPIVPAVPLEGVSKQLNGDQLPLGLKHNIPRRELCSETELLSLFSLLLGFVLVKNNGKKYLHSCAYNHYGYFFTWCYHNFWSNIAVLNWLLHMVFLLTFSISYIFIFHQGIVFLCP